ncbi:MAG TPA: hypothetical protein VNJ01_18060 [Bacteriovoracaceae bacterium]|nr:hypothetical protein [Bacteriovoracaceae bacterium]
MFRVILLLSTLCTSPLALALSCEFFTSSEELEKSNLVAVAKITKLSEQKDRGFIIAGTQRMMIADVELQEVFKGKPGQTKNFVSHVPKSFAPVVGDQVLVFTQNPRLCEFGPFLVKDGQIPFHWLSSDHRILVPKLPSEIVFKLWRAIARMDSGERTFDRVRKLLEVETKHLGLKDVYIEKNN